MLDFNKYDPTRLIVTLRDGKKLYAFNLSKEGQELYDRGLINTVVMRTRKLTGWEVINIDEVLEAERKLPDRKVGYVIKSQFKFYYGSVFLRNRWVFVVWPN